MKKWFSLILILAMVWAMAGNLAYAASQYAYVSTPTQSGTVYVRAVAGAGQPIVGVARNGDALEVLKKGNTWHRVRVIRTGDEGYIYGVYLKFIGASTDSSSASSTGGAAQSPDGYRSDASVLDTDSVMNVTGTISSSDGYANLRWGPGTNYPAMGTINNNNTVWVLEKNGSWYRCYVSGGRVAYIHQNLVKTGGAYSGLNGKTGVVRSSDGYASVRSGAGTSFPVSYSLKVGQSATVWSTSGDWFSISGYSGWNSEYIYRTLLRFYSSAQATGNVYLRTGPDKTYSQQGVLNSGTRVTLLATDGNFARVDTGKTIAYVSMKYLNVDTAL